jgi:hypothetical protein
VTCGAEANARRAARAATRRCASPARPPLDTGPDLFGAPAPDPFARPAEAPAQRHSTTSTAAAEAIAPRLSGLRRELLAWICERHPGGATDNTLVRELVAAGWSQNTPRARRIELARADWLEEAGTRDGSTLWRPTAAALRWHRDAAA